MTIRIPYQSYITAGLLLLTTAVMAQPTVQDAAQSGSGANNQPVSAQWQPSLVRDGAYDRTPHVMRTLGWQPLREADVLWKKRVWREIDTREKQNLAFRYPGDDQTGGGYFIEILLDAVKKGKIKGYSTFDDRFTSALTKDQIMEKLLGKTDTIPQEDPVTGKITMIYSHRDFNPDIVTKYRVKEDWIFDRNLGRMVVRIIGIAPLVDVIDNDGNYRGTAPLMWIYYPEARPVFAQYEVFNPENDVHRLTWDDYLEGRYWSGRIIKVSNGLNEDFKGQGYNDLEALYKDRQIDEKLFDKEHDMWVY
ncbi:MAG: gliding motility protein GldN [Bacteroidetes bacterium]|nr:gliding motility protein GldN [Bacteroidota bacterium]